MFDVRAALKGLDGQMFQFAELQTKLSSIVREHRAGLPPDYKARDLLEMMREFKWVEERGAKFWVQLGGKSLGRFDLIE
jgi:hypothetical protein